MKRLFPDAWRAVAASGRMLIFREGWQSGFDISLSGFWRSFSAFLLAVPMIAMIHVAGQAAGRELGWLDEYLLQAMSWILFPLAAAVASRVMGVQARFVRWVIVHNWAVLWLYGYLFVLWTLYTAGLLPAELMGLALFIYPYMRVLVHWRIAYVSLGLPTIASALTAAVPILATEIAVAAYFSARLAAQPVSG